LTAKTPKFYSEAVPALPGIEVGSVERVTNHAGLRENSCLPIIITSPTINDDSYHPVSYQSQEDDMKKLAGILMAAVLLGPLVACNNPPSPDWMQAAIR
jgi:hypothetical protein